MMHSAQHPSRAGAGAMYFRCREAVVAAHLLVDLRSRARAFVCTCGQDGTPFCSQANAVGASEGTENLRNTRGLFC